MARASNTDERRSQIAAALLKVMARHGYDGASIADIAGQAGLATGLVHYHYKDKREILLEALRMLVRAHAARIDAALAHAEGDPGAQLVGVIDLHLGLGAHADAEALACWVVLGGEALRQRPIRVEFEAALVETAGKLTGVIERGVAAGRFRCDEPAAAAAALVATIQGYFVVAATARAAVPHGSAAGCTVRMAEGLLRPKRPLRAAPAARRRS